MKEETTKEESSMTFGTPSVAVATTPAVFSTFFKHFLKKRSKHGQPEAELSYDEGLQVVKRFLDYASGRKLEEVQAFTAMHVPHPTWVHKIIVEIPDETIDEAGAILSKHLDSYGNEPGKGLGIVGGDKWWRVRGKALEGEWIEMQKDYLRRTKAKAKSKVNDKAGVEVSSSRHGHGSHVRVPHVHRQDEHHGSPEDSQPEQPDRVILYIHGGAYFFSSLDTHRYQIQRHARKLGGRAFAPSYRLAPQYPFPCGLLDALASYLYLISPPSTAAHTAIPATSIILAGDSAGAGMVLSLLVLIREMKLPMPAGANLISPWVDLTHSMPSIMGDDSGDYIPSSGFHYRPSVVWPPLPDAGMEIEMPDGSIKSLGDQIQMYCPNNLLSHPLVSPINQASLGGLCPLMIIGGGSELLRDEIIYVAHKAASPTTYPPSEVVLARYPSQRALIDRYKPTKVHLQIYDGCAHVTPTLSFTKPAKYMYRAAANFNIWALTAADKALERHERQRTSRKSHHPSRSGTGDSSAISAPESQVNSTAASSIDLTQPVIDSAAAEAANESDVDVSDVASEASSSSEDEENATMEPDQLVSVRGVEPPFGQGHLTRERVSTKGHIRPFEAAEKIEALRVLRERIGSIHGDGAITKWLAQREKYDSKYSSEMKKLAETKRADWETAQSQGYLTRSLHNENPPLCSLASWYDQKIAREVGKSVDETSSKTSGAMALWMKLGTKADAEQASSGKLDEIEVKSQEKTEADEATDVKPTRSH